MWPRIFDFLSFCLLGIYYRHQDTSEFLAAFLEFSFGSFTEIVTSLYLDRNDRETFSSSSNGGFRSNMREARRDDGDTYGHSRGGHGQFYDSFSRGDTANYSRKERSDFSERGHKSFSSSEDLADTGSRRGSRGQTFGGRHFRETERNFYK